MKIFVISIQQLSPRVKGRLVWIVNNETFDLNVLIEILHSNV